MFQFVSVATYPASRVASIVGEADRRRQQCRHLDPMQIQKPVWAWGSADAVRGWAQRYKAQAKDAIGRKIRSDSPILLAGVVSLPTECAALQDPEIRIDPASGMPEFEWTASRAPLADQMERVELWLNTEYFLPAIVWHFDEGHPHCHFFAVGDCKKLHPGTRATYDPKTGKRYSRGKKDLYRGGLVAMLDRFHAAVSAQFGWERKSERPRVRIKSRRTYLRSRFTTHEVASPSANPQPARQAFDSEDQPASVLNNSYDQGRPQACLPSNLSP